MDSIWISIGPIVAINVFVVSTLLVFLSRKSALPSSPDLKGRHQSLFLGRTLHEYWYWLVKPVARFFVKIRFSPNILTSTGFCLSCVSAYLFARGWFGYAGWVMNLGATFDVFDGHVARMTNQSTRSGAYFDSVMDRFGEGFVFMGIAYYYRADWMLGVVIAGMIGSMLVSYTRARGEGVGVVCKKGPMQRPERIAYLGIGSVLQPIADTIMHHWMTQPPAILVIGALCIIAVLTMYTALYRTVFIMNALDSADRARDAQETIPQMLSKLSTREGREALVDRARYGYDRSQARYTCSVVFVIDGAHTEVFRELLQRGDLPNIRRHLVEPGSYTEATTVFPSTAGPSATPIVTGCFPGTCNIPGVRWFDRTVPPQKRFTLKRFRDYSGLGSYAIDFDLSKEVRTIFEYSRQAVNLLGIINRGSGLKRDPAFLRASWHDPDITAEQAESMERALFELFSASLQRNPDFVLYYFPTIQYCAREYGIDAQRTKRAYRRLDQYVGDVVEQLKTHGMYDHTALVMLGSYGHGVARESFDLDQFVGRYFPRALHVPSDSYRGWLAADAISMVSGNAMAQLYLRRDQSWSQQATMDALMQGPVVNALLEQPAVDLVMGRGSDGGVLVRSRRGCARIVANGTIRYEVEGGGDPFGYGNLPRQMSLREALTYTAHTQYPDGIVQAAQLFRSSRAGDLVISAGPSQVFASRGVPQEGTITHGALTREHMSVPCAISLPALANQPMRTADLFPTLLHSVGLEADHQLDGQLLAAAC